MRFIPTSTDTVESLKKQAKKLQRKAGGKHAEALDRVARGAGYNHWHHVTLCLKQESTKNSFEVLKAECELVVKAALGGLTKLVMTGPELLPRPLVLLACEGDAWLLEPDEKLAMCLVFQGELQPYQLEDEPTRIKVGWDGTFELAGQFFKVETNHPRVGTRAVGGFPVDELRNLLHKVQSFEQKFSDVIRQQDAVELTPEIIAELVRGGWPENDLLKAAQDGAQYSPSRHSLLFPLMTDDMDQVTSDVE